MHNDKPNHNGSGKNGKGEEQYARKPMAQKEKHNNFAHFEHHKLESSERERKKGICAVHKRY